MKWARRAILCLTFLVAALAMASALDPASGPQASLAASPASSASGPVEVGLDIAAPGPIVGRKVVYGMSDNANIVYKYIRIPRPLRDSLAAMASADAAEDADADADGSSLAEGAASVDADRFRRKRKNRTAKSSAQNTTATSGASASSSAKGVTPASPRDPNLVTVPAPLSGPAPANATHAAVAAPTVPGLSAQQTARLDAALTSDLRFSRTALALVFLTALAVGTSMGVAVHRYSFFKKKADDSVRRYKAFAVV